MKAFENILYLLTDIVLLFNIIIFTSITQQKSTPKTTFKFFIYFIFYILVSLLFNISYFDTKNAMLMLGLFLIYYSRFPLIISKLTNASFFKGIYITFIISQTCDLIQTLICNIINIPNLISKYCVSLIIRLTLFIFLRCLL